MKQTPSTKSTEQTTALLVRAARGQDSLRKFGRLLGCSQTQVAFYEAGDQEPDDARCEKWGMSRSSVVSQLGRFILEQRKLALEARLARIAKKGEKNV
jgi:hypothetical protein